MTRTLPSLLLATALAGAVPSAAQAQATDPFLGQIMTTASNFCPKGWAETQGQLLAIAQNTALFSLLTNRYGGDGKTTFALPTIRPIFTATGETLLTCIALQGYYPSQN